MTAPLELTIRAIGTPAPQGSFFAKIVGGGERGPLRAIVVADNAATKPWRQAVSDAAKSAMRAADWLPLNEPLAVEIVFFLPRPKTVKRALQAWSNREGGVMSRGYFAIGIYGSKTEVNVGTLWRSATLYGAAFVFTVGRRYQRQASDTPKTPLHTPLYCSDPVIPGLPLCADHWIEHCHRRADAGIPPATPTAVAAERDRLGVSGA